MELHKVKALVTGSARRVGRAIALDLARSGADLALHCHHRRAEAEALADEIRSLGRCCTVLPGDLCDPDFPGRLIAAAAETLGGLNVLVNNAAVFKPMSLTEFDRSDWCRILDTNLTAVAALCHHAQPHLASPVAADLRVGRPPDSPDTSGTEIRGKIVNLCDIAADRPWPGYLAYCVSKAGLVCLTKALARELAPHVQVNGVSPGIAVFPDSYDEPTRQRLVAAVPLRRPGSPEEIARAVRFLIEHDYITGQILAVDGGRSIA